MLLKDSPETIHLRLCLAISWRLRRFGDFTVNLVQDGEVELG